MKSCTRVAIRQKPIPTWYVQMWLAVWPLVLLLLIAPFATAAQSADDVAALKKQIDALQEGQKEIQKELEAIRALLAPPERPVPASLDVTANDTPFRGEKAAKVTLVEYFDYQCPFCAGFEDETMPLVLTDYIMKGKVRYIVRDFPLETAHPNALQAAEAARCANDQGKFWPMHDALMGNSDALDRPKLSLYAQDVGLDVPSFDKCVDSGKYASIVKDSMTGGTKVGVEGTPTFFLGVADPSGQKIVSLKRLEGNIPYSQLKDAIDKLLAEQQPPTAPVASH
jgi:protein-disulfide isomerase